MFRRILPVLLFVSAASAATSSARIARAGNPREQQLRQALVDERRRLMDKKCCGEAGSKLAESQRLDPGGGTLLKLAICHEKEVRLATAKNDYDQALALVVKDPAADRARARGRAREQRTAHQRSLPSRPTPKASR